MTGVGSIWRVYRTTTSGPLLRALRRMHELGAFAVITLGVIFTKHRVAQRVVRPLIREQIWSAGWRLLPMVGFIAAALGLVIVGQTVGLLARLGAQEYIGTVMVTVLVRELGPLLTAVLVLARAGTANVVELGTARALGEVEALESLGIDPIHYLVVPRVIGLAVSVFCLTTYLVGIAILCGWLFAFLQDVPLPMGTYFGQISQALRWQDFALFGLKTVGFGVIVAVVNCYHGLARPLRVEEISGVTSQAVVETVTACVLLDAVFIVAYIFV